MANPTIKIAEYSVYFAKGNAAGNLLLLAENNNPNMPQELGAVVTELDAGKQLRWTSCVVNANDAPASVELKIGAKVATYELATPNDVFNGTALQKEVRAKLSKTLPKIEEVADVMTAAFQALQVAYGPHYPGAAVTVEDDKLIVKADTAIAVRGGATAGAAGGKKAGPAAPKRPKGKDTIRVWI